MLRHDWWRYAGHRGWLSHLTVLYMPAYVGFLPQTKNIQLGWLFFFKSIFIYSRVPASCIHPGLIKTCLMGNSTGVIIHWAPLFINHRGEDLWIRCQTVNSDCDTERSSYQRSSCCSTQWGNLMETWQLTHMQSRGSSVTHYREDGVRTYCSFLDINSNVFFLLCFF